MRFECCVEFEIKGTVEEDGNDSVLFFLTPFPNIGMSLWPTFSPQGTLEEENKVCNKVASSFHQQTACFDSKNLKTFDNGYYNSLMWFKQLPSYPAYPMSHCIQASAKHSSKLATVPKKTTKQLFNSSLEPHVPKQTTASSHPPPFHTQSYYKSHPPSHRHQNSFQRSQKNQKEYPLEVFNFLSSFLVGVFSSIIDHKKNMKWFLKWISSFP